MNLKIRTIVTLSSTLVAAILLDIASCDTNASNLSLQKVRPARKYYEIEDLNRFQSPLDTVSHTENPRLKRSDQQQRVARQKTSQQKQRPGFFWTLARVTYEVCIDISLCLLWLKVRRRFLRGSSLRTGWVRICYWNNERKRIEDK